MISEELKPCPFCGSSKLQAAQIYLDEDGERNGVECLDCDAIAPLDVWNKRFEVREPLAR